MAPDLPPAQLAATVVLNLSVAIVAGASMAIRWLRAASSSWAARHVAGLRTAILAAGSVAILAYVSLLWLESASMAEVPLSEAGSAVKAALAATHYGFAWTVGICSLAVAAAATALPPRHGLARIASYVRLFAIGTFLYSRSIVSHAGAGGDLSWAVAADWLHLVLISVWTGEVLVAGWITLRTPAGDTSAERLDRANHVQALSNTATIALAGIVATGVVGAWRGLGSMDNATGNPYATALLIKVALAASAALLGGTNRFFVMPALLDNLRSTSAGSTRPERLFAAILQLEAVILVATLVMAAILSSTSPPTAD